MWYMCLWRLESRKPQMDQGLHIPLDWLASKSQSLLNSRIVHSCHQIEVLQIKLWFSFFLTTFLTGLSSYGVPLKKQPP